jgi:hypothetical protein
MYSEAYFWLAKCDTVVSIYRQSGAPSSPPPPRPSGSLLTMRWDSESERQGAERGGGLQVGQAWCEVAGVDSLAHPYIGRCYVVALVTKPEHGALRQSTVLRHSHVTPLLTRVETCTSTENTYFTDVFLFCYFIHLIALDTGLFQTKPIPENLFILYWI